MNRRDFLKTLLTLPFALKAYGQKESFGYVEPRIALYWEKLPDKKVKCQNCPHQCILDEGKRGLCRVRENRDGSLYTLVYGNPCAVHLDPIEKKPLYHFLPGTTAFSIATAGCNFRCKYCQNYAISQVKPEYTRNYKLPPKDLINNVLNYQNKYDVKTIAYTYTEPTIFIEYMIDSAQLAHKNGIRNIYHSAGYIKKKPLREIIPYLDGANVDLKFFTNENYLNISNATLKPVLETLKDLKEGGVWLEITYLIVPTINDGGEEITEMIKWVLGNLGSDVPLHFSRFYPTYRLENLPRTPLKTVEDARNMAMEMGVHYAYVGNVPIDHPGTNTYCPGCGELLIKRRGYSIIESKIKTNKCPTCKKAIAGVWK
ncbi:hypothetical protein ES703_11502 [subsurface metagenome]